MKEILYLECYSGISGDMTVAALLDLGADQNVLKKALDSLKVDGFKTQISHVKKSGIDACDFSVILDKEHENHDHDMNYLHGHENDLEQVAQHTHVHGEESAHLHAHSANEFHTKDMESEHAHEEHEHEHHKHEEHDHEHHKHEEHEHEHHKHEHEHRTLTEINAIICEADLSDEAKNIAMRIFGILGDAEAKAHGIPRNEVHFHEVGAVDSIVDIVAIAVCLENLNIKEAVIPVLYEGSGHVRCQHGLIPIPVPAVLNIAQAHQINLALTGEKGEFVTPTGAAVVAAIKTKDELPKQFKVKKVGIGAGKRNYEKPSLLRAMILEY